MIQKVFIGKNEYEIEFNYKMQAQKNSERILKKIKDEFKFKLGGINDTTLFAPIYLKEKKDSIYILDQIDCAIKVFDDKGRYIRKIGTKGKGPGEFLSPKSFDIGSNNEIAVIDFQLRRCTIIQDTTIHIISLNYYPEEIVITDSNKFCVLQGSDLNDFSFIEEYDYKGNKLKSFQNVFKEFSSNILPSNPTILGRILKYKKGIIYTPNYFSHFTLFNSEGKVKYSSGTIEKTKIPPLVTISLKNGKIGMSGRHLKDFYVTANASIRKNSLNLFCILKKSRYLDVYSIDSGKYQYSYRIYAHGSFTRIFFTNNNMFVIRPDGSIDVYRVNYGE